MLESRNIRVQRFERIKRKAFVKACLQERKPCSRRIRRGTRKAKRAPISAGNVKEIDFPAGLPPLDIQRLAVDLMFDNFERNQTKQSIEQAKRDRRHDEHIHRSDPISVIAQERLPTL